MSTAQEGLIKNKSTKIFEGYELHIPSARLLPHPFCLQNNCVILGSVTPKGKEPITIGVLDPNDFKLIDLISMRFPNRTLIPVKLTPYEISKALHLVFETNEPFYDKHEEEDNKILTFWDKIQIKMPKLELKSAKISLKREQPIIELLDCILQDAIKKGANDIHIESYPDNVDVRYKIDGILFQVTTPINKDNIEEVISRIKVMANLDIAKKRIPQDGRIMVKVFRNNAYEDIPVRVAILPGPAGEDAVLRILDKSAIPLGLHKLGFSPKDYETYKMLIHNPQGMILVTGPTGSGKTTTLYSTLEEINTPHNKILSAEDPIEYTLEYVNQKQVSKNFSFADLTRAFLRQNPDIILIGEIRDEETADIAVKAALTGHLILSTLHTNDSVSAISRFRSLGVNANILSSSLLGVLSQRLVRKICPNCAKEYKPDPDLVKLFSKKLNKDKFIMGLGCSNCNFSGYKGRIGIFELLLIDEDLQIMIREDKSVEEIQKVAIEKGLKPLIYDAIQKVEADLTTLEEIVRVIPYMQIHSQLQK